MPFWTDQTTGVYDLATGKQQAKELETKFITIIPRLSFSPDGIRLWVAGLGGAQTMCWNSRTLSEEPSFVRHRSTVFGISFRPDGCWMLSVTRDGTGRIWNAWHGETVTETIRLVSEKSLDTFNASDFCFSRDGRFLIGSRSAVVPVWELGVGAAIPRTITPDGSPVSALAFSPDSRFVAAATDRGLAGIWEVATGQQVGESLKHPAKINAICFTPDGSFLATAAEDGFARVWSVANCCEVGAPMSHNDQAVAAIDISSDGKRLATAATAPNGFARVWRFPECTPVTGPLKHGGSMSFVRFDPSGSLLAAGGNPAGCKLWDTTSGRLVHEIDPRTVWNADFAADGRRLLIASSGSDCAWIHHLPTGRRQEPGFRHMSGVWWAEFSRDGRRIATSSLDGTARIWDASSGKPLTEPIRHRLRVDRAIFSPDGRALLTASLDGTARLWDAASGRPLTDRINHDGGVSAVAFSPNGRSVATAGRDGKLSIRDWITVDLPAAAWLSELAEGVGGYRIGDLGVAQVETEGPAKVARVRAQAKDASGALAEWADWFFAGRANRRISPFASVDADTYIRSLTEEVSIKSLEEAVSFRPCDPNLLVRLAEQTASWDPDRAAGLARIATRIDPTVKVPESGFSSTPLDPHDIDGCRPYMGKQAVIEGQLLEVGTNKSGTIIYLNFTIPFNDSITIVCFVSDSPDEFSIEALRPLAGKRIRARGILGEHKGSLQLRLRRLADLTVLE